MNKYIATIALFILSFIQAAGQDTATDLAGKDKINVVIGVLSIIFIGLAVFLFMLDRRITKLEKQKKEQKG